MIESRHTVLGMVCSHCAAIVGEEIGRVPGVTDVRVDIAGATVVVRADRPVPQADIHAAVEEAGYTPGPPSTASPDAKPSAGLSSAAPPDAGPARAGPPPTPRS
ncbi:heavy-metal-associated domain-containing protein [Streptomyces sp. B8F3]|uniref:heavy-metal-associated domain-containing protein n=1 Tax=unclassified Streptomyces TaxID=2593676 RepID=UPI00325D995B